MAEYTKYLRLIKPGGNDYYNIDDFNQNSELIDKETEKLNNAVTEIKNGATREKAGIVQYGTTEGKALEGMMLARMFGCVGYGGDIQDPGAKNVNYVYFDRNTRKMYKCLNQNSDVSANVANFIPLDNNSLLDRLENLIKIDTGITGNYTNVGAYNFTFPKNYKQVLGVAVNVYKTGTATTLENVYVTGFNNTSFSFVKDCVDADRANTVKVAYTVFYI